MEDDDDVQFLGEFRPNGHHYPTRQKFTMNGQLIGDIAEATERGEVPMIYLRARPIRSHNYQFFVQATKKVTFADAARIYTFNPLVGITEGMFMTNSTVVTTVPARPPPPLPLPAQPPISKLRPPPKVPPISTDLVSVLIEAAAALDKEEVGAAPRPRLPPPTPRPAKTYHIATDTTPFIVGHIDQVENDDPAWWLGDGEDRWEETTTRMEIETTPSSCSFADAAANQQHSYPYIQDMY